MMRTFLMRMLYKRLMTKVPEKKENSEHKQILLSSYASTFS